MSEPSIAHPALVGLVLVLPLAAVIVPAVWHAVRTRRSWKRGTHFRAERLERLDGPNQTFNAVWGIDTILAVRKIAALRGDPRPRVSTHFVVVVSVSGIRMLYGHGEDQGTTHIRPSEVRALQAGSVGPPAFTAWLLTCEIRGRRIVVPIRLTHTSSDFLNAEYAWAQKAAVDAYALLTAAADGSA
ncbi:hypothetical protein [Leifsonia sp. C5G2]|uniref:hypothetical protein n=1 Tax=Leifsonia sp. C5G2 TaxID=2735269 RepID=UPI0015849644|nr:hypothetical protein [Leifsonia sp. C5G2]NUU07767.1 hypothetical protein [Leifsonia sp. C5G2]